MRTVKVLIVAAIAIFALTIRTSSVTVSAQVPSCTDANAYGPILTTLATGPSAAAFKSLSTAATADDFATIVDAGIQAQHTIEDLQINASDTGCFYLQLAGIFLVNDEIDVTNYGSYIKLGLKNADAYQKGLTDATTRLQKDAATFQTLTSAIAATPAATAAQ